VFLLTFSCLSILSLIIFHLGNTSQITLIRDAMVVTAYQVLAVCIKDSILGYMMFSCGNVGSITSHCFCDIHCRLNDRLVCEAYPIKKSRL